MLTRMAVVAVCCLCLVGCDAKELGYVELGKYDALQKQYAASQEQLKMTETDLKTAQQQVSECQAHKYQIYKETWRTWRLDTVTGATCILLTTEADWKKPETTAQGCF
jgi:hypothetical protein